MTVKKKLFGTSSYTWNEIIQKEKVCECFLTFVTIDPLTGKSVPHKMTWEE